MLPVLSCFCHGAILPLHAAQSGPPQATALMVAGPHLATTTGKGVSRGSKGEGATKGREAFGERVASREAPVKMEREATSRGTRTEATGQMRRL